MDMASTFAKRQGGMLCFLNEKPIVSIECQGFLLARSRQSGSIPFANQI